MSRQKPRFTPDPPPYGASNEQILAWVNAQLQRIEDYWPRDDGDRITALEELQSKYSGEWSISGQSLVRFEGSVSNPTYALSCAGEWDTYWRSPNSLASLAGTFYGIVWSPDNNRIYSAQDDTSNKPIESFDIDTETFDAPSTVEEGTRGPMEVVDVNGYGNSDGLFHFEWRTGLSGRTWNLYNAGDLTNRLFRTSDSNINAHFVTSNDSYIYLTNTYFTSDTNNYETFNKGTGAIVRGNNFPSGWEAGQWAGAGQRVAVNENLIILYNNVSYQLKFYTMTGTAGSETYTPRDSVKATTVANVNSGGLRGRPLYINSELWWPIYDTVDGYQWCVTSEQGTIRTYINMFNVAGNSLGISKGGTICFYHEESNAIYYRSSAALWQYKVATNEYDSCALPSRPADFEATSYSLSSDVIIHTDYAYFAIPHQVAASTGEPRLTIIRLKIF